MAGASRPGKFLKFLECCKECCKATFVNVIAASSSARAPTPCSGNRDWRRGPGEGGEAVQDHAGMGEGVRLRLLLVSPLKKTGASVVTVMLSGAAELPEPSWNTRVTTKLV